MTIDGTTIGILGLVLAGLGVIATVVAPRFVGGARLSFALRELSPLRHREQIGTLRISVFQDNDEVTGNVYLLTGSLTNCGSKDVSYQDFVDPIKFSPSGSVQLLSIGADANDGIGERVRIEDGLGFLDWRILKPKEIIDLSFVMRSDVPLSAKNSNYISSEIRLKDVKHGQGAFTKYRIAPVLLIFTVLFFVLNTINIIPITNNSLVYVDAGQLKSIRMSPLGIDSCLVERRIFYLNKCSKISISQASDLLSKSRIEKINTGMRPRLFYITLGFSFLYAVLIVFGIRFVGDVFNYRQRRRIELVQTG